MLQIKMKSSIFFCDAVTVSRRGEYDFN